MDVEQEFAGVIIFMVVIFLALIIYSIWYYAKEKDAESKNKEELKLKMNEYNSIFTTKINHICGLPLVENSECIINLCEDRIVIESSGNIYKLQKDKIKDMNIKTSKEVQNSLSGAVGGAMLLGPIGAFLYGTTAEFHRFFIIIYKNKENIDQCISFDMKDNMKTYEAISNYIEEFKNNVSNKEEIDL